MLEQLVRQFLYHPMPVPRARQPPAWVEGAEEVWMRAADGNEIHGLYWAPPIRDGVTRPTILFLHGNAQTVFEWAMVRTDLQATDTGMLLIDYPGYGKSRGVPNESSLYAAGRAAVDWLGKQRGTRLTDVVVFGKSLGGGVATELCADATARGLILESTFCSVPDVAKRLVPFLPTNLVFKSERYPSLERMGRITAPVLVIHGERDTLIPVRQGRTLYERANQPKQLYLVADAGHNDVAMTAGAAYGTRIRDWLEDTAGTGAATVEPDP